ncbi:phosphotransferase [Bradyrhizobium sp. UFLA03-84]|uniref:phosphotransferase n=1 Tax=Bradyrhizobium sp. UFLA03-84 TaxID=418599 RepID=UPI000BAE36CB|nr:phosphotransferase [Bradyrhizobium sp. UFLA03-84]PAY06205.1 phosphotransferase [Bradyrhizobium sp. UFLA03-84]
MQGTLGEKIGDGLFADVHAWAPGQVVKLAKPTIPQWVVQHEMQMTRAVFAAGGPAPDVLGEVTLDGRFGIVLPRFDGPTLLQATRTGAITHEQAGAILATLCHAVHKTRPPPDALSLREAMDARLRFGGSVLPERIITGVLALIEHLASDDVLCHSDLHPGNVIMTAQGPRLIDWIGAARAPAAYEIAQCHVLIAELDPEHADDPGRATVNSVLQAEYARLAGTTPAALTTAMQPYLPIVRVFLLLGGAKPDMRERLVQRVEAALRPEG